MAQGSNSSVNPQSSLASAQASADELNAQKQQQLDFEKKQKEIELWQQAEQQVINGVQA
jgi:hypothetical protein